MHPFGLLKHSQIVLVDDALEDGSSSDDVVLLLRQAAPDLSAEQAKEAVAYVVAGRAL